MKELFEKWIEKETKAKKSGYAYSNAINTISNDMMSEGVIVKNIYNYTDLEDLKVDYKRIMEDDYFKAKDSKGNRMYSRALKYYLEFLKNNQIYNIEDEKIDNSSDNFEEGRKILEKHLTYERNATLVKLAKTNFKQKNDGRLYCEICGFDFNKFYGDRGQDFIEAHHKKPVSQMGENEKTSVDDLCMVCSNCHRMLHRQNQLISVDELKEMIKANRK